MKKAKLTRGLLCFLLLFACFTAWALAEDAADTAEAPAEVIAPAQTEVVDEDADPEIGFGMGLKNIWEQTGLANGTWQQYVMIVIACFLLWLAIVKQFEPLLLLPIAFGMLMANLPLAGLMDQPGYTFYDTVEQAAAAAAKLGKDGAEVVMRYSTEAGKMLPSLETHHGGLYYYLYMGVKLGIYPELIFMGVGAMTDFAPLIANPKSLLMGAGAQLGIYIAFILAKVFGFGALTAASIGIIGGADGPTAIYVTTKLDPAHLGAIAVAAYSYMALVPVIQPPIMKALTTKEERKIVMRQLRPVSKLELVVFPIMVTIVVSLILPSAAPLVGMLMFGNLLRVCGVVERLNKTVQNELENIVTIFLALTVGATANGENFLSPDTIKIIILGVLAFSGGTAGGLLVAKFMNLFLKEKINPLIGSAGVSAVPMAARVSQKVGQKENPSNFLLMHAMGPNVSGVIGSAVAAGVFIALFGH